MTTGNKNIIFFALYPVYDDEMTYKLEEGSNQFFALAESKNLTELLDIERKSIVAQKSILEKIATFIRRK